MLCFEEKFNDGAGRTIPWHGKMSSCSPHSAGHRGPIRETAVIVFNIYMCIPYNPWRLPAIFSYDERYSKINCYRVGMRRSGAIYAETPKKVSPNATHKPLLRLMMLTLQWRKLLSPMD